jgi:hypothetical protein
MTTRYAEFCEARGFMIACFAAWLRELPQEDNVMGEIEATTSVLSQLVVLLNAE